ncbi:4079_t:CDS:2 [Scutellospora calospora]|uniref:4079_t:CDS:1 n=1 Tax=Scutellospora calospora TaxID=85575 RepID=A0ACA9M0P3_9GLOM|nr:4079_t:CDS:2 [Scutellospora calospora]
MKGEEISVYSPLHKLAYTKKLEQYAIPDQYIFDKYMVYSTKSLSDAAAKYCKSFKRLKNKGTLSSEDIQEINANTINKNENKKKDIRISGVQLFGLQLNFVRIVRKMLPSNTYLKVQPFNNLSNSTQRHHMLTIAKLVFDQVEICKENIFHKDDKVEIKQARFTINDKLFEIQYEKVNQEKIDDLHLAVLKSLDKGKIFREAYQSLARINQDLPREGAISSTRQRLNKQMQNLVPLLLINIEETFVASELTEDQPHINDPDIVNNIVESAGKGEQRSIIDILNFIVSEYIKKRLLIPNNTTIKLRISGDSRNIGRKIQHVMVMAIILNDIERLHKSEGYHTLVLYSGSENYQSLQNALCTLIFDLNNLRESRFYQLNSLHWNCTYMKQQNGILDQNNKLVGDWTITKNMEQIKKNFFNIRRHQCAPLFDMIDLKYWVCDELHILLRITDRLFELFLSDLQRNGKLDNKIQQEILVEMKRIGITFQFWTDKNTKKLCNTSLMGPNKLKLLHNFNFKNISICYLPIVRQNQLRKLWNKFAELYDDLHQKKISGSSFKKKAIEWLEYFLTPSQGHPNKNFVRGLYQATDCTPYMHVLTYHIPEFIKIHRDLGLIAFSCSALEKKNYIQVCRYFQNTLKDGGHDQSRKSAILEILEHENQQLFYWQANIPSYIKKATQYRLE